MPDEVKPDEKPEDVTSQEEAQEPEDNQPQEDTTPSFLDVLKDDLGFEGIEDEDQARERLVEAYRQTQEERERLSREAEQYKQEATYYRFQSQKQPEQQEPRQQEPQKASWPTVAQLSPALQADIRTYIDQETGTWKPETPPAIRDQAEQYLRAQQEWQYTLADPTALQQLIQSEIESGVNKILETTWGFKPEELPQKLDINGERAFIEGVINDNAELLYAKNPVTGQLDRSRLSEIGEQFVSVRDHFIDSGAPERAAYEAALLAVRPAIEAAKGTNAAASTQDAIEQKKRDHLVNRAKPNGQRGGSTPRTREEEISNPQNEDESPFEAAGRILEQEGFMDSYRA